MRGAIRAAVAAAAVAVLVGCAPSTPMPGPTDNALGSRLKAEVTGGGAVTHLQALQRIADDNGGTRVSPGPGYAASVDYVAGVLRDAGLQVSTPTFQMGRRGGGEATVRNVIAQTRTGNTGHVVMIGAHLDSVRRGPGINDNGSGVAALLEIATRLGGSPSVTNAIRFAFWGGEEENLDGSTAYVEGLSDAERTAIALYVNVDMVASPNGGYFVHGGAGGRSSGSGPPGSAEVGRVLADQLASIGVTPELTRFDGSSDYEPFLEAEIPTGGVLAGDAGTKSAEQARRWGGQAGEVFDPCYHAACDRLDSVNRTALDRFSDALAGTLGYFATTTDGPAR
ncbi:M28 family peptidase [Pseudonocardia hispaniensis]|uniref:M28 family peptidase n=1 Tax=Pseudonocardia hispaniensis TaxID=904933 RepID=A0ABW1J295_9PSEU